MISTVLHMRADTHCRTFLAYGEEVPRRHIRLPIDDLEVMRVYAACIVVHNVVYAEERRDDTALVENAEQAGEGRVRSYPRYLRSV